jgi:hypothetical protein
MQFLPEAEYNEQFTFLRKGHKIRKVRGVSGVAFPAAKGTPWLIQEEYGQGVHRDDVVHESDSEDPGISDNDGKHKFDDLVENEREAVQDLAAGVTMDDLLAEVAAEAPTTEVIADTPQGKLTKRRTRLAQCRFSDSGDESDKPSGSKSKPKATALSGSKNTTARRGANVRVPVGKPKSKAKAPEDPDARGGGVGGGKGPQVGRKAVPIGDPVADQLAKLKCADEASNLFGAHSATALKSVRRYLSAATINLAKAGEDEQHEVSVQCKNLQVVESAIKINTIWQNRPSVEIGVERFERAWQALIYFVAQDPKVPIECNYLWDLLLQVRSGPGGAGSGFQLLISDLALGTLAARYVDLTQDELRKKQLTYTCACLGNLMSSELDVSTTKFKMCEFVEACSGVPHDFAEPLMSSMQNLALLLRSATRVPERSELQTYESALNLAEQARDPDPVLGLLLRFRDKGDVILQQAQAVGVSQRRFLAILDMSAEVCKSLGTLVSGEKKACELGDVSNEIQIFDKLISWRAMLDADDKLWHPLIFCCADFMGVTP